VMDSVILYFPTRYVVMATRRLFARACKRTPVKTGLATDANASGDRMSALAFCIVYVSLLHRAWTQFSEQSFATAFPTGRARTAQLPIDLPLSEVVVYICLPLIYIGVPFVCSLLVHQHKGSMPAVLGIVWSLVVGWQFHLGEKWALDIGCAHASWFQPTAVYHALSAVTIGCAYLHMLSVQEARHARNLKEMSKQL
jgi:hypothetical protein